ncbi:A-kinase anchor protein 12b isoform X4 [Mustelus asterias]
MGAGVSAQEAEPPSPTQSPSGEASDQERQHTAAADRRPVQKNGQISGIHGNSEDQEVLNGKLEQLNGLQEEAIPGKVEPPSLSQEEEQEEMELEQKETPTETKDEPKDSQEAADTPAEIGEEAQAGEVGFKKVFKFVGCKITVKKEKPVKLEPVQLLTVKKGEDGEVDGESKQEEEGTKNGEVSPVAEAEGSPPEILSPLKTEESSGQAELKPAAAEEISVLVESAASPAESSAVDSPLKRFFRQGFFSVLRRKPSFKKAKDEPLVIGEKTEENGEQKENGDQVIAPGDVKSEEGDHGAKSQKEAPASEETAEILDVQAVEEKREKDDDFEDLTAELADVREAKEAPAVDGGKDGVSAEQDQLQEPGLALAAAAALEKDLVSQLTAKTDQSASAEGEVNEEFVSLGAPEGLCAEQTDVAQEQSSVKAPEPVMGEAELLSSQEKAKLQGSPLKKLFTSSSIKKLSSKRTKGKKGESKPGDTGDDARLQSSTESEGSPEGQKPESPLTSPEEMGEAVPAETADAPDSVSPEAEGVNGSANGEAKKESITAWASFKKLVTSKKRQSPKIPSESDKEDEPTDKAKSATISSNESAASVEKEEAKSITEEPSLEQSTEDPRKKADAPVSWEALICVGSSKKRARKLSDSEAPKPNEEAQRLTEESGQLQEDAEEVKVSSPPDTDQEHGGTSPEGVASPVEEVSAISTWESFKRLVTSRRKSKSKLEERVDEPVAAAETIAPETEPAKEESWASFKKLIPGRRKKRSDTKPEPLAEGDEGDARWAELGVNKSDEESDTPAVVPLSEYDAVEEERMAKEQQITIAMEEPPTKLEAPAGTREPSAEQTVTIERGPLEVVKSSIDERSPSWISAAVSNAIEKTIDEENIVEGAVAVNEPLKEEAELGDSTPLAEVTNEIDAVEVAEEAQEVTSEVVTALEYPAEESLTEETTEMVSAVSQLTETPATTAEGTPIREDEALVTRQTQEVLQEAAERVKLSAAGPAVSSGETPAASEAQEPEIALQKIQAEMVAASSEIEVLTSAREAKMSDAASEGTASVESEGVRRGLSEMVQQTAVEMQEASAPQSFKPEPRTIPPMELEATAEVALEVEADVAQTGEGGILPEDQAEGPAGTLQQPTEEIPVQEIATACTVEAGMSETVVEKVEAEEVQSLRAGTLESSGAADVAKPGAPSEGSIEVTGMSCLGEALPEGEDTVTAAPAETAETLGMEEVTAPGEALEAIPAKEAVTVDAILEQTDGAIQKVAPEVKVGKVEVVLEEAVRNAQEVGGEVEAEETVEMCREILASGVKVEVVCEQSTEIVPECVSQAVCNDEAMAITPAVTLTEVFSEEIATLPPAVEVTEAALSKETIVITPVVTVAEVLGEEMANLTPAVEVSEATLADEENVQIIPVVGVTEVLHSEETIKNTPVVQVMEIACMEKAIKTSPIVVTEVVCSADATKITPVVGVEAVESEGTVKIGPAVEVMEAVCTIDTSVMADAGPPGEGTEISPGAKLVDVGPIVEETEAVQEDTEAVPIVEETEAVHGPEGTEAVPVVKETEVVQEGTEVSPVVDETESARDPEGTEVRPVVDETEAVQEGTEVSPVVEEMEAVRGPEGTEVSPVVKETEAVRVPEGTKVSPVVEETEAVQEGTEISPVVEEMEAVSGPEGTEVSPIVDETETIHGQEAIDASPALEKIESVDSRETIAVGLVKVGTKEDEVVYEGKDDLAITQQQGIEKDAQMMAIDNDEIAQEQFGAVKIIREIVKTKECGEASAENIETKMSETVCKEIKTLEETEDKQRTKEQVVEMLIPATEVIHPEPRTVELSKETIQTLVTERTVIEVVKCVETEIDPTVCNKRLQVAQPEGTKEEPQIELRQEASVVEVTRIATEVNQHIMKEEKGPTELPRDEFEILLGAPVEKTEVMEAPIAEEVESKTKESHLSVSCVTSEPQSTATEELMATREAENVKQVVELVGEVECDLSTMEKDKPAPREAEFIETSHTDGEPVLGDQLDGANKDGQGDVAGPKECENAESQKDAMEDSSGATDERVIQVDSPGELASTHTSTEGGKEEPELDEGLALGSDHKVKLHSDSVDKLHAVQSETVTPIVGSSVAPSSESHKEVLIPVTEAAAEEQIVTETAASEVTELSELSTGDQVSQAAQPNTVLGPVAETAAAIVEVAIEAAAGTVVSSPSVSQETGSTLDGQKQQSSPMEQLEGALVEQPSESLEMETEVKVGETRIFEQQRTMLAQGQTRDAVMPTEVQVDAVSAGQGKDSAQLHKEDKEKVPELQTVAAAEGKSDEVISQSLQTQEVGDTEALEQEIAVTQSTEVVSEAAGEGDQKLVETEVGASVEAGQERELLPAPVSEGAAIMPDVSKITKVECCQSVEKPEGMPPSPELTETKEQPAESQPQPEEQASLQDVPAAMTSPVEESRTQDAADEKLEGAAVEPIEHKDVKETDQSKMAEAVEKQGSQEMPIEHQMDQSSTLECAKSATEKTPS